MAATSKGHSALLLPSSTSEFQAMTDNLRAHHSAMHGQLTDIAAYLRGVLPEVIAQRGGARRGLLGVDARLSARKVVRPLQEAAAMNEIVGKLYVVAFRRHIEYVVNAATHAAKTPFDADH